MKPTTKVVAAPGGKESEQAEPKKTSVKVHATPGGNSTFTLGWGGDAGKDEPKKTGKKLIQPPGQAPAEKPKDPNAPMAHSKVSAPPGGKSNIQFG